MLIYIFDGSVDGIFTCVYRSIVKSERPAFICTENEARALSLHPSETVKVKTNFKVNKKIIAAIYNRGGINALNDVKFASRSGNPNAPSIIFEYIRKTLTAKNNISGKFSDENVLAFYELIKSVSLEVYRFKSFLRFNKSVEGIYYARFEPDNDIADILASHFKAKFKNVPFAVHDVKRNVATLCGANKITFLKKADCAFFAKADEKESAIGALWRESNCSAA